MKTQDIRMIDGEFEKRTPESQGISSGDITACLEAIKATGENVHSLHIFRNGFSVAGGSALPFTDLSPRRVYSTMKSVIALAVLFLVQEGKLSFEDRIADWFKEDVPADCPKALKELTLRQTLNMSVGQFQDALTIFHASRYGLGMIPFTQREKMKDLPFDPKGMSLTQLFFSLPVEYAPGTRFHYVNTVPELLIRLVTKAAGEDFINYLRPRLFEPLKVDLFNAQETMKDGWSPEAPSRGMYDHVETYLDGSTSVTTAKDLCKFALFLLQKGRWEGRQLLSEELVTEATSMLMPTWMEEGRDEFHAYGYGMQIWRNPFGGFSLLGGSGQAAVAVPEEGLVVVYTSMNTHLAAEGTKMPEIVRDFVVKRLYGTALPEDPEGLAAMEKCFKEWSTAPEGLSAHREGEVALAGRYVLKEPCDGITTAGFDFKNALVRIEQGSRRCYLQYGLGGAFERNTQRPKMPAEGYSKVYGGDPLGCFASGGWAENGTFVLQLQYSDDLRCFRYSFRFDPDGTAEVSRRS